MVVVNMSAGVVRPRMGHVGYWPQCERPEPIECGVPQRVETESERTERKEGTHDEPAYMDRVFMSGPRTGMVSDLEMA